MGRRKLFTKRGLGVVLVGLLLLSASIALTEKTRPNGLLGGDNTVDDVSVEAFTNPLPLLTEAELVDFEEGDELFEAAFVAATGETVDSTQDGLGPLYNAVSCEGCHVEDGRGRAPEFHGEAETGFLLRLGLPQRDEASHVLDEPRYGGQFQDIAVDGAAPEGEIRVAYTTIRGTFADGTTYALREPRYIIENLNYGDMADDVTISPRVANHMVGLGLLEAVSEETIMSFADPYDLDGDGISGRPNRVPDLVNDRMALGRFGWKAGQPSLLQQTAAAYVNDMGITSWIFPEHTCVGDQTACITLMTGGEPEVSADHLDLVTFYAATLAVPAQRNTDDPQVQYGAEVFETIGCSSCHVSEMTTGTHPTIDALSNQTIQPYTDLLLHDMGEGLADGHFEFEANGSEWRTPPLWGLGLFETVNEHTYYLHDGRAQSLLEAILWHGGEAEESRNRVLELNAAAREALIAFLESL